MIERDLIEQVDRLYNLMGFAYDLNYNCYYGYKEFFNYENLLDLYLKRDLIKNVVMNFGYIY